MTSNLDGGTMFGTWPDRTSRLMYHDAMPALLNGINTSAPRVLDLGGANGLLREWFAGEVTTVDLEADHHPDVVADARKYVPTCAQDLVVMRYLLHYLDNVGVLELLRHVAVWHHGTVVLIQFVNDDVALKYEASLGEPPRWYRTHRQLLDLIDRTPWRVQSKVTVGYEVDAEFYRNRLGSNNGLAHSETIVRLELAVPHE